VGLNSFRAAAAQGGGLRDPARLERMFHADYRFIWRLLRRLGVPETQVDDAAQQVFLIAAERMDDIQENRERAFAFGTALRLAQSLHRRSKRETISDTCDESASSLPSPDDLADQRRNRELLGRVLDGMPLELRTVFILYELETLSSPEIAELIEIPLGTVASRLRRARAQFKALVELETTNRAGERT
jgi:RNA polymerase sigma-70 factor, ECF subfamily